MFLSNIPHEHRNLENYQQGKYQIKTFNKISPIGLSRFPPDEYDIRTGDVEAANAHAILLRSHKLKEEEVPKTVRAIARYVRVIRIGDVDISCAVHLELVCLPRKAIDR